MQWYGSLQNRLDERTVQPKPYVGMGATAMYWSDRYPYEVIAVKDDRHITVREMGSTCIDYFAGEWEVYPNPDGCVKNLYKTKRGQWRQRIGKNGLGDVVYCLGVARRYEDPSF